MICTRAAFDAHSRTRIPLCPLLAFSRAHHCQAIKKEAFEKAIQSEEVPSKEQDPSEIEVEASYSGPRMEDGAGMVPTPQP
jgi:hypothetical protein